jgi:hypothetical protein
MMRTCSTHSAVALLLLTLLTAPGCSRAFYRMQADEEVYHLVERADQQVERPPLEAFSIKIDPRSRMFDPFDPDFPPMPADDPRSNELMQCVDGMEGYPCWTADGVTSDIENPSWRDYLPYNEQGRVVLDHDAAMQMALLQSPSYQRQLENLYLSALDVTFEQFRFDTQFFGGNDTFFTADGRDRAGGMSSSQLDTATALQARKMYATGAELVVGMANRLVWEFSGSNSHSATTLLDFSLVQPLLRAGGRAVVLERLTRVERALLANIRQLERYRRGFYTDVVAGLGGTGGVSRVGGVFGGSGLEGFSGVGSGGFGQIGNVVGGGGGNGGVGGGGLTGAGGGFAGGAGAAGAGGFLGLLQTQQAIRNREANVAALRDSLAQLDAAGDAGRIDRLQIDQARQALYNAQSQLLTSRANYERGLDSYKNALGLPPELDVEIKDSLLNTFDLIDPKITVVQDKVAHMLNVLRDSQHASSRNLLAKAKSHFETIAQNIDSHLDLVGADIELLETNLPARRKELRRLANLAEVTRGDLDREAFSVAALKERVERIHDAHAVVIAKLQQTAERTTNFDPAADSPEIGRRNLIRLATEISNQLVELSLVQARARLDSITLMRVELTAEQALEIARCYRRDWMNARASLVDSWRLIDFNANALESEVDIVFEGDISNRTDNPFEFRDSTGRLRVGVEFDAPLTRLSERNQYRQSLIDYSQARRNYYRFEDGVNASLRNTLRTINLDQINFELRRAAVTIAIAQVELTQLKLSEPLRPGAAPELSNTTARDLVSALSDLLAVQNDFLSVWVNYQVQRMQLDLDLGTMELAANGMWIDPGAIGVGNSPLQHAPAALNLQLEAIPIGPELAPLMIE